MWPGSLIDHIFFRKRHWHLISKLTFSLVNALNHHWCETILLPQAVLKHVVSRDFILKNSVCGTSSVSRRNTQVGHLWITSGLLCGSVGQVDQQVWPTFNPVVCIFSIQDVVTNIVFTLSLFAGTVSYTAYSSDSGGTYEEYRIS